MILFVALSILCLKKDLSIFMKVGSFGVIFVFMLIFSIMFTGFSAFKNTDFMVGTAA